MANPFDALDAEGPSVFLTPAPQRFLVTDDLIVAIGFGVGIVALVAAYLAIAFLFYYFPLRFVTRKFGYDLMPLKLYIMGFLGMVVSTKLVWGFLYILFVN